MKQVHLTLIETTCGKDDRTIATVRATKYGKQAELQFVGETEKRRFLLSWYQQTQRFVLPRLIQHAPPKHAADDADFFAIDDFVRIVGILAMDTDFVARQAEAVVIGDFIRPRSA